MELTENENLGSLRKLILFELIERQQKHHLFGQLCLSAHDRVRLTLKAGERLLTTGKPTILQQKRPP
jgi:hypothetical protein